MDPSSEVRSRPWLAFGLSGGLFALVYVLVTEPSEVLVVLSGDVPALVEPLLVVGGFVGGSTVGLLLWHRLDAPRSTRRATIVGGLVGLLSLPIAIYVLALGSIVYGGIQDGVALSVFQTGTTSLTSLDRYVVDTLLVGLFIGAVGVVFTGGLTVVVGAVTGYLLVRQRDVRRHRGE